MQFPHHHQFNHCFGHRELQGATPAAGRGMSCWERGAFSSSRVAHIHQHLPAVFCDLAVQFFLNITALTSTAWLVFLCPSTNRVSKNIADLLQYFLNITAFLSYKYFQLNTVLFTVRDSGDAEGHEQNMDLNIKCIFCYRRARERRAEAGSNNEVNPYGEEGRSNLGFEPAEETQTSF